MKWKWNTRTRTKIMIFALIQIAYWANLIIWAWAFKNRDNAHEMLSIVLGSGVLALLTFLWTIMNENNKRGK